MTIKQKALRRAGRFVPAVPALTGIAVVLFLFLFPWSGNSQAAGSIHHDLRVTLEPERNSLHAADAITLPSGFPDRFTFLLHAGLRPKASEPGVVLSGPTRAFGAVPLESFEVTLPRGTRSFKIEYGGRIHHPLESVGKEQARGFNQTPGSISGDGVYLADSSAWYPLVQSGFVTFDLSVDLPEGWDAVSQGIRMLPEKTKAGLTAGWNSPEPQDAIYLIASRFFLYEKSSDNVGAMVFLRKPDAGLAGKYLDATLRYIAMYDMLIGPYPYKKFALVENFWETGFGMPSFTLLGPTVLRLPFIINTSYPHEILHNWWGNSVYPDYETGNWSEGLTAYLADHLLKEQQGEGAEYRLNTLQKYSDYVSGRRDFALARFTSRHSSAEEAVGYGKSLMFFHMLRQDLGDGTFVAGLRHFYRSRRFRMASFDDIRKSLEAVSGRDLEHEFRQWVTRPGAPRLQLQDVQAGKDGDQYVITARLRQIQPGEPCRLRVPVAVTLEGQSRVYRTVIDMTDDTAAISIAVPSRPLRLDIDPEFDVFRMLDKDETPPAITQVLGAQRMLVVLPAVAERQSLQAYQALADSLARSGPDTVELKLDTELKKIPGDRAVVILGWENKFLESMLAALSRYDVAIMNKNVRIGKTDISQKNHSVVLTARNPGNKDAGVMFIAADSPQSVPGLARKLPHYHKYSYLIFEGQEPENIARGRWEVEDSPMTALLPGSNGNVRHAEMGALAPREALASLPPVYSGERMMETVQYLSSRKLQGRETGKKGADLAADYIADKFKQAGLIPGGVAGSYFQVWEENLPRAEKRNGRSVLRERGQGKLRMKNVIGIVPGSKPEFAGQSVVIGAHYDHLGLGMTHGNAGDRGKVHPGADDNASGVALLVELAGVLREVLNPDRNVVFVAFAGEEEGRLGSTYFVKNYTRYPVARCMGMLNLDTVGRLGKQKLLVLGAASAPEWAHIFRGAGFVTGVEIEAVREELDSSDQESFRTAGVPAVQLFSGPHPDYHRPTDTSDKIDAAGLVKIAAVVQEVIEYLAGREGPLTPTISGTAQSATRGRRSVTFGTIPDFAYGGKGVRLSGVVAGSPAEAAGLKEGDVIIRINESEVEGLRDFSDILKTLNSGDKISVAFIRNGREMGVGSEVKER